MEKIAEGSTYQINVKELNNKIVLSQDNGQKTIIHKDDITNLISVLTTINNR